jgi:hypothetical protein
VFLVQKAFMGEAKTFIVGKQTVCVVYQLGGDPIKTTQVIM